MEQKQLRAELAKTAMGALLNRTFPDGSMMYDIHYIKAYPDYKFSRFLSQEDADKNRAKEVGRMVEVSIYIADAMIEALNKSK